MRPISIGEDVTTMRSSAAGGRGHNPSSWPRREDGITNVRDIEIWRDGGTITFTLAGDGAVPSYRLRTPFGGKPRLLFCDERELAPGGGDEAVVLAALQAWLASQLDGHAQAGKEGLGEVAARAGSLCYRSSRLFSCSTRCASARLSSGTITA